MVSDSEIDIFNIVFHEYRHFPYSNPMLCSIFLAQQTSLQRYR